MHGKLNIKRIDYISLLTADYCRNLGMLAIYNSTMHHNKEKVWHTLSHVIR